MIDETILAALANDLPRRLDEAAEFLTEDERIALLDTLGAMRTAQQEDPFGPEWLAHHEGARAVLEICAETAFDPQAAADALRRQIKD